MIRLEVPGVTATIDADRGGRLASLRVGGRELLVGPPDASDRSIRWGCFLMAPWPGRLAGGRLGWRDATLQVPRTHGRHAIHGLVWDRPWTVDRVDGDRADLSSELPRDVWPMGGRMRESFVVAPDRVTFDAAIEADEPMPAALGWHPWFVRDGDVAVRLDADEVLETRGMIPTGRTLPASGRLDLRGGRSLGSRRLDHAYMDPRSPIEVRWPDLDLEISFGRSINVAVVYTTPLSFCVEPQTAWPDAFNRPAAEAPRAGVRVLEAGETLAARMELRWGLALA